MSHWLVSLNLEQYVSEFGAQNITGEQLLQLDGNKLKVKNYVSVLGHQVSLVLLIAPGMSSLDPSIPRMGEVILIDSQQKGC